MGMHERNDNYTDAEILKIVIWSVIVGLVCGILGTLLFTTLFN